MLNTAARTVSRGGQRVPLTAAEYSIFEHLAMGRGRVFSKEQLIDAIHDGESCTGANVVEVLVCTLRKKLDADGGEPLVQTRRGYGYCIE